MNTKRIVITGGPGTGKTTIINELIKRGYNCLEEISRQITIEAQEKGIDQLFLTDPLLFSEMLLQGRTDQYLSVNGMSDKFVFLDRGIPDVLAYMDFKKTTYPQHFIDACMNHQYDHVFILAPWQEIYISDNERYETFEQATQIHDHLLNTYKKYDYHLNDVPFGSTESRTEFILNIVENL